MTEERKQELRQLLTEAMASLEIRRSREESLLLPVEVYRMRLYQSWTSYSEDLEISIFDPHIVSETTKSKLLDFIRAEFAPFIHNDQIQSASFFLQGGSYPGYSLESPLTQLLKISIVRGIEGAVSVFDRCTEETYGYFQYMALLEGITLETEIQVFEGLRLVPLPRSTSELPHYLSNLDFLGLSKSSLLGKTVLIVDCSVSPIFYKPFPTIIAPQEESEQLNRTLQVRVNGGKFPNFKMDDFYEKFCQALSLACHSAVQTSFKWSFLAADELFNLNSCKSMRRTRYYDIDAFRSPPKAGETQIEEAKRLYHILVNLDSNVSEKLRIPINRWIQSKASGNFVDKMIDLGIAFEAFYLSDIESPTELAFRLRLHAASYLGKDKEDRKVLMKEFQKIYDWRSSAVHTGKLPNKKKKIPFTPEEVEKLIERAQDLCRESIIKVLDDEQFPDWNSLILGGEVNSDAVELSENPGRPET